MGRLLKWGADSKWTHVFLVLNETEAIEAMFLRGVQVFDWRARLAAVQAEGREFVVLDRPVFSDAEREAVTQLARTYVGRRYDYLQALLYGVTNSFWQDGPGRLICSRLITTVFYDLNLNLFPKWRVLHNPGPLYPRRKQLLKGWATPAELVHYGFLTEVSLPA